MNERYDQFCAAFRWRTDVVDNWAREQDDPRAYLGERRFGAARFTFSDIARLTDKFGNMLRGHGIEKGDRVIIMFPRIPEWAIAMVGALKIGAIPIPLTACAMLTPRRRSAARPRSKAGASILFGP
jgi:acetyl-CoA synthetase